MAKNRDRKNSLLPGLDNGVLRYYYFYFDCNQNKLQADMRWLNSFVFILHQMTYSGGTEYVK